MFSHTFLDLARQWKYAGVESIEFVLLPQVEKYLNVETFITTVERLLESDIREAEGYMSATLDFAEIKDVGRYTVGGSNGRQASN